MKKVNSSNNYYTGNDPEIVKRVADFVDFKVLHRASK